MTGCCCARSRRLGKQTNQKNMERRSKDVETPLWKICKLENDFVQGQTFPHKKCWLKCLLMRWLFWPCRSFLSRFCNDLRSASFVCVFLATATCFIVKFDSQQLAIILSLIVSNWHLQLQGHDHDLSPAQLSYTPRMWGHGKVIPRCQIQSHTSTLPLPLYQLQLQLERE